MKFSNEILTLSAVLLLNLLNIDAFQTALQTSKLSITHRQPVHLPRKSTKLYAQTRNANPIILFQKVVRAPTKTQSTIFLPSLIEYIQHQFELPKQLPMIYESNIPQDIGEDDKYSILEWNSELSSNPDETRMEVEIVGIYTEQDEINKALTPSMAMVVVKKMNVDSAIDVMMKRMFDDSEQKIVKALENGLDDFIDGKIDLKGKSVLNNGIEMDMGDWKPLDTMEDFEGMEDASLEDLLVASSGKSVMDVDALDVVDDTKKNDDGKGKQNVIDAEISIEKDAEPDFAVQAAKAAAARRKEQAKQVSSGGDFAVQAAKAVAKKLKKKVKRKKAVKTRVKKETSTTEVKRTTAPVSSQAMSDMPQGVSMGEPMPMELPTIGRSPMLDNLSKRKGSQSFQVKISNSETFKKRDKAFEKTIHRKMKAEKDKDIKERKTLNIVKDESVDASNMSEEEHQKSLDDLMMKQLQTSDEAEASPTIENGKITKTDAEIERDILKAAMDIMPGTITDEPSDDDMSAEELLKSILKFGDEKEKGEADGSGFVNGAFSKAKELSQQEKKMEVGVKEREPANPILENIKYPDEPKSTEDELKDIFAAGEKIAESRMTTVKRDDDANALGTPKSIVTEEYVDDLIAGDKTIGAARSLDDELAQLEVRISKTVGEDTDAYGPNPVFDVFSGPEVYNPNVDPLTSVNWPGALPNTRTDIKLPPELEAAVKSADFAAKLLSKMVEEEQDDETKEFYIDGKKINDEQVRRLRKAVEDGVQIGLIDDPIEYMKERSRLQMLVNELVNQPDERFSEIAEFYKDLLLSDNFVTLLKENLKSMAERHLEARRSGEDTSDLDERLARERFILGKLVQYGQLLLKEVQALSAELETTQMEVIRSICNVAMDPDHNTEEETAEALTVAVRDMKPLLDENFVAYLKYAIAEEEGRLARSGLLDDPEHNRWLFVLKIVQEGVYNELAVGVQRYIDHIGYVLRMNTKQERKELLSKIIDAMPSLDIRPFFKVVDNIAASLGQGRKGEFDASVLGGMTNKILQLRRDVHDLLPPERIKEMSKEADEWAARRQKQLMEQRGVSQQRLKAARESINMEDEVGRRGEVERFT